MEEGMESAFFPLHISPANNGTCNGDSIGDYFFLFENSQSSGDWIAFDEFRPLFAALETRITLIYSTIRVKNLT